MAAAEALGAENDSSTEDTASQTARADDQVESDKPPHKKVIIKKKKRKKRKRVVVHRRRARSGRHGPTYVVRPVVVHRKRVVVTSGPPVVETVVAVPRRRTAVTHRQVRRRPVEDKMLGVGIRLNGIAVEGEKLNLARVENPTMWGLGLQLRGKVSRRLGLEVAGDWLYGRTGDVAQTTIPISLSLMYYLVPRGKLKVYGLVGGGVHLTKLEYDRGDRHDLVEVGGQAGGGIELRLTRDFGLNADLRFLGMYKNIGEVETIENRCLKYSGPSQCGGVRDADKFDVGAQFMVGASLYF